MEKVKEALSNTKLIEIFKYDDKLNKALNDYYDGRISKTIVYRRLAQAIRNLLGRER